MSVKRLNGQWHHHWEGGDSYTQLVLPHDARALPTYLSSTPIMGGYLGYLDLKTWLSAASTRRRGLSCVAPISGSRFEHFRLPYPAKTSSGRVVEKCGR